MAIQISGTTVIDNSRNITNTPHVDLSGSSSLFGFDTAGNKIDSWNPESAAYGRLPIFGSGNFRVYTSPGTFCVSPGVSAIRVRVVGAGGNGGTGGTGACFPFPSPSSACRFAPAISGAGGAGGGYAHKCISSFPGPRTYTVTVGAAPGGTSSFGSEVSATGGSNGGNGCPGCNTRYPSSCCYIGSLAIPGGTAGSGVGGNVNYTGKSIGICMCRYINCFAESSCTWTRQNTLLSPPESFTKDLTAGGAAGTQLGNASSSRVPSVSCQDVSVFYHVTGTGPCSFFAVQIPNKRWRGKNIKRFPFDIFDGYDGVSDTRNAGNTCYFGLNVLDSMDGCDGGVGGALVSGCHAFTGGQRSSLRIGCSGYGAGGVGPGISCGIPTSQSSPSPYVYVNSAGGNGGIGGGGGGGGHGASVNTCFFSDPWRPARPGCAGGSGGPGLVIVEW